MFLVLLDFHQFQMSWSSQFRIIKNILNRSAWQTIHMCLQKDLDRMVVVKNLYDDNLCYFDDDGDVIVGIVDLPAPFCWGYRKRNKKNRHNIPRGEKRETKRQIKSRVVNRRWPSYAIYIWIGLAPDLFPRTGNHPLSSLFTFSPCCLYSPLLTLFSNPQPRQFQKIPNTCIPKACKLCPV